MTPPLASLQWEKLMPETRGTAMATAEVGADLAKWLRRTGWGNQPMNPRVWWDQRFDEVAYRMAAAQLEASIIAAEGVDKQLLAQARPLTEEWEPDVLILAGVAGDGRPVEGLPYAYARRVAEVFDAPEHTPQAIATAWEQSGRSLVMAARTAVADAARASTSIQMLGRQGTGWIRAVTPPCCSRCAILAGKMHRSPTVGFQRHPGCDCIQVPIADFDRRKNLPEIKDMVFDPGEYFDALTEAEQNKIFTRAGAAAIRDGADPSQVGNARRGISVAADGFRGQPVATTEGTTKRGHAYNYIKAAYRARLERKPGYKHRMATIPRLMPEEIYRRADGDTDLAISLLHKNGYLRTASPRLNSDFPWHWRDAEIKEITRRAEKRLNEAIENERKKVSE